MSDQNGIDSTPSANGRRRSSFAGIMDMFAGRGSVGTGSPPASNSSYPGPITHAAAQAQQRRLSVATTGLGASPPQQSPFDTIRSRGQSISASSSGSLDESPFEEADGPPVASQPNTPFARRVSFGAQAMRDMRSKSSSSSSSSSNGGGGGGGGGTANGRPSVIHATTAAPASDRPKPASSPPTSAKSRDGFNFAENMRARAERGSISASMSTSPTAGGHIRAKSVAVMEPPVREMPTQPRKPDHFQERILKGDFYMD